MLSIESILTEMKRPLPYQGGAELWRDPHIAGEMLKAHLSPDTDAASYMPDRIRSICDSLPARMGLTASARVVDLGCGPGFYCHHLAKQGFTMTGMDWSENSIRYAETLCAGQNVAFRMGSYLEPFAQEEFGGALLISQDYGVLSPKHRKTLLHNIHEALGHGGTFALDVPSRTAFDTLRQSAVPAWEAADKGFWRPHPYMMLTETHFYPDISASCNLYAVLDDKVTIYRIWQTYFTPDSISGELREGGFDEIEVSANLMGEPWAEESPVLGIVCRKA
jgi:SAM-dependent methyltransferase